MLHKIIYSLYYPAILGVLLALFLQKISSQENLHSIVTDLTIYQGLLMLFFFTASYLEIGIYSESYEIVPFILDIAEIVCIFFALYNIGYVTGKTDLISFSGFYFYLFCIIFIEQAWNLWFKFKSQIGVEDFRGRLILSILGLFGIVLGWIYADTYLWINICITVILALIIGIYFFVYFRKKSTAS